jgi:hypothetical protein
MPHTRSHRHPSLQAEAGGAAATLSHQQPRGQPLPTPPNRAPRPPPLASCLLQRRPRPRRASAAPCSGPTPHTPSATGTTAFGRRLGVRLPPQATSSRAASRSPRLRIATPASSSAAEAEASFCFASGGLHRGPSAWPAAHHASKSRLWRGARGVLAASSSGESTCRSGGGRGNGGTGGGGGGHYRCGCGCGGNGGGSDPQRNFEQFSTVAAMTATESSGGGGGDDACGGGLGGGMWAGAASVASSSKAERRRQRRR